MRIRPHYPGGVSRRWRKRDGMIGYIPDDGRMDGIAHQKAVCWSCRRGYDRPRHLDPLTVCPTCGGAVTQVHPMTRLPRSANVKGWRRLRELVEKHWSYRCLNTGTKLIWRGSE